MDNAKPQVAIFITLAEQGGAQLFVFEFAKWLIAHKNYEVTVYAGEGEWLKNKLVNTEVKFVTVPGLERDISLWSDLAAIRWLAREWRITKPLAVHLNSAKGGFIGSLAARLARVPRVVYRIGGWTFLEQLPGYKQTAYRLLEKWTAPLKDIIICVHPGDVRVATQAGIRPKHKLLAIPNGINLASFDQNLLTREQARQSLEISEGDFVYGTNANFYPAKAIPAYLKVCAELIKHYPNTRVALIGDGPERSTIEQCRRELKLEEQVLLFGNRNDAAQLLRAFDAFVLPSTKEGMSWALLEAMAAELPCIATDVGAARWMLTSDDVRTQSAGWIVPPNDSRALLEAMLEARDQNLAQTKAAQARAAVHNRFPLEQTLKDNTSALEI